MKKLFILTFILFVFSPNVFAMNFGMYQPEEDYGLIDGFKLNFGRKERDEAKKFIQVKTEIPDEVERMKKEKARYEANKDQRADDEYQMFKFMLDDTIAF